MKKEFLLLPLGLALSGTLQASDWRQQLVSLNPDVIDSVSVIISDQPDTIGYHSYMIHYHQPLQHDDPQLGNLPLRALLTLPDEADVTDLMMQMNISGYNIDDNMLSILQQDPERILTGSSGELAGRYGGNLLQPEHRYFGQSCPENPWESLGYCEAKEAAADFHALVQAMKRVFTGKWAITGISKGGITTTMQHAFYPDDADCFVPYSGPFLGISRDLRMQDYYMTHSWTPELNEKILRLQRRMTSSEDLFAYVCSANGVDPVTGVNDPVMICDFANLVAGLDLSPRAYYSRQDVNTIFAHNESVLQQMGLDDYSAEMMFYMLYNKTLLIDQAYLDWYNEVFVSETEQEAADAPRRTRTRLKEGVHLEFDHSPLLPVFGIGEQDWTTYSGYYYQATHELGYFDLRFDYYFDDPQEGSMVTDIWQSMYSNVLDCLMGGLFAGVEYNPELFAFVRQQTAQAKKPILFLYGQDDVWAGAHMEDEHINGDNVRLYVLPEQNHMVSINAVTDTDLQAELWAFTDAVFAPNPTGIRTLHDDASAPVRYYDLFGRRLSEQSLQGKLVLRR